MDSKDYWEKHWSSAEEEGWEDNPSLFAQFTLSYLPKEGRLLELGAGLGKDSRYFSRFGFYVISTDFSDKAIDASKWEAAMQKITNIDYQNVDITKTFPFKDKSFNIVYAHAVLHYFSHEITDQIFNEIHRVLTDGGVLATLFKSKDDPEIKKSKKLHENFYQTPSGLVERFFDTEEVLRETSGLFKPVILDSTEQLHETDNATYIRYIGLKIPQGMQVHQTP